MSESYHSSRTRHKIEFDLEDARKAQNLFTRFLLNGKGDVDQMAALLFQMYPTCYLDPFQSSGNEQFGAAMRFAAGTKRQSLNDRAGRGGSFIVSYGGCHDFRTIFPSDVGLELGDDRRAQFDRVVIDLFHSAVIEYVDGDSIFKPERGEKYDKRLHAHVITAPGACSVGWFEERGPEKIIDTFAYIHKKPWYTPDNVAGYVEAYRERGGGRVKRLRTRGLNHPVTVGDVQLILPHLDLLRPADGSRQNLQTERAFVIEYPLERERIVIVTQSAAPVVVRNTPSVHPEPISSVDSENTMVWSNKTEAKELRAMMAKSYLFKDGRQVSIDEVWPVVTRPTEVDTAAALASLERTAHLPQEAPQFQVWGNCPTEPVYDLYAPENENLGRGPPHFIPVTVMFLYAAF